MKTYKVISDGKLIATGVPGKYAGNSNAKIFGTLDCKAGMRLLRRNRVFFAEMGDAIKAGYGPCKDCRPISDSEFAELRRLARKQA